MLSSSLIMIITPKLLKSNSNMKLSTALNSTFNGLKTREGLEKTTKEKTKIPSVKGVDLDKTDGAGKIDGADGLRPIRELPPATVAIKTSKPLCLCVRVMRCKNVFKQEFWRNWSQRLKNTKTGTKARVEKKFKWLETMKNGEWWRITSKTAKSKTKLYNKSHKELTKNLIKPCRKKKASCTKTDKLRQSNDI